MSSSRAVVGPAVLVVMEGVQTRVLGIEAAIGIALPHKRHFNLNWHVGGIAVSFQMEVDKLVLIHQLTSLTYVHLTRNCRPSCCCL
jgi:hypothetical protein